MTHASVKRNDSIEIYLCSPPDLFQCGSDSGRPDCKDAFSLEPPVIFIREDQAPSATNQIPFADPNVTYLWTKIADDNTTYLLEEQALSLRRKTIAVGLGLALPLAGLYIACATLITMYGRLLIVKQNLARAKNVSDPAFQAAVHNTYQPRTRQETTRRASRASKATGEMQTNWHGEELGTIEVPAQEMESPIRGKKESRFASMATSPTLGPYQISRANANSSQVAVRGPLNTINCHIID